MTTARILIAILLGGFFFSLAHGPIPQPGATGRIEALEEQMVELRRQQALTQVQLSAWAKSVTEAHNRLDALPAGR